MALLRVVGGGLKDALYVAAGFQRAARINPNDTSEQKAPLSLL